MTHNRHQTMRRLRRSNKDAGFSLIEVMIAVLVLGVAMLGLFSLQEVALSATRMSAKMSAASMLARGQMEYLMGLDYEADGLALVTAPDDLTNNGVMVVDTSNPYTYLPHPAASAAPSPVNILGTTDATEGALIYYVTWNVNQPFVATTDVIELTVRVSFEEGFSYKSTHGVTITSYRYRDVPL